MGRPKLNETEKRQSISLRIPNELLVQMDGIKNKSKFVEWLLQEYFNKTK